MELNKIAADGRGGVALRLPEESAKKNTWQAAAIILDFDGVIVESVGIKTEAFRQLFSAHPTHLEEIIDYHLINEGLSRYRKFDHIYREILHQPLSDEKSKCLGRQFSDLAKADILKCPFVDGVLEFLEKCRRQSINLFIASGTPETELREIVEARNLSGYFDGIFGSPATKSQIINGILDDFRIGASKAVFVGDTLTDYSEARVAGVKFIGRSSSMSNMSFADLGVPIVRDMVELEVLLAGKPGKTRRHSR